MQNLEKVFLLNQILYHYKIRESSLSHNHAKEKERWCNTILAHQYIMELFPKGKLFRSARAQYYKKMMQAVFFFSYHNNDEEKEDLKKYLRELKGNFRYIYADRDIRLSSKMKAFYVQILTKKYNGD